MSNTRYSCQTQMELQILLIDFRKTLKISIFMKIRPVGAELFHADGQTDGHDDLIFARRNFANEPKNVNITI